MAPVAVAASPPATTSPRKVAAKTNGSFTWRQVAEHNRPDDAWVIIGGKVYDVTEWVDKHPGGRDVVVWAAGRDATQLFDTYHENTTKATAVLKKYEIGTVVDNELPVFPSRGDFFQTLKKRLDTHFKETRQDPKFHPMMLVRYALVFGTLAGSYYLQFFNEYVSGMFPLQVVCALVLGFACAQVGLLPMHDASHCSITRNPWVWRVLGATHDFLNGASFLTWCYQHMLGHHPYTNVAGADPDITTAEPSDFRRIKPSQEWYEKYIGQERYIPFLYGLLGVKTRLQDVKLTFVDQLNDHIRVNPVESWHWWMFWMGKAFFVLYRFVLPLALTDISVARLMSLFVVADLVSSYWLALTFQANHVVDGVEWPLPDEKNEIHRDWAEIQVVTAQDYAHDSFIWTNLAGSLNYQIVHHLFPNILQYYYPEIAPIVIKTCGEFGIKYRVKDTYHEAFQGHIDHLKKLGLGLDQQRGKKEE